MDIREMRKKRAELIGQNRAMLNKADEEKRGLTVDEQKQYDAIMSQVDALAVDIAQREKLEREEAGLNAMPPPAPRPDPNLGMSARDVQQYSLLRAINASVGNDWSRAGLELEASQAVAARLGRAPRTFFVPVDVLVHGRSAQRTYLPGYGWRYLSGERRDMLKGTPGQGGYLVGTDLMADAFIDMLRNKMVLQRAGAFVMSDLVGDVAIARKTAGGTAYWVAENGAPTESQSTLGQLALSPKTVGAYTEISRKMLKQASLDAEQFVRQDLTDVLALAIDLAGLHGSGASNQPSGVAVTSGVGAVFAGGAPDDVTNPDGAEPVWADVVNLESAIAAANADVENMAYIVNAAMRGKMKQKPKAASTDSRMIWDENSPSSPLNGYAAFVTNQVASDGAKGAGTDLSSMFFGNWADLFFALWGTLDILVNPFSNDTTGAVRVTAFQDIDIGIRHPGSFAFGDDFITV